MQLRNLVALLKERKLNQKTLAELAGISEVSLSNWKRGKHRPRLEEVERIAKALGVTVNDLIGAKTPDALKTVPTVVSEHSISVYGSIRAGNGTSGITDGLVVDHIAVTEEQKKLGVFSVRVSGDSMEPELRQGDYALFRPMNGHPPRDRDLCAVEVEGWDEWVVKYVRADPSGLVYLISANPAYKPIEINPKECKVTIRGTLVETRRLVRP